MFRSGLVRKMCHGAANVDALEEHLERAWEAVEEGLAQAYPHLFIIRGESPPPGEKRHIPAADLVKSLLVAYAEDRARVKPELDLVQRSIQAEPANEAPAQPTQPEAPRPRRHERRS